MHTCSCFGLLVAPGLDSSAPKPPDPGIGRSGTPTATPDRDLSVFALEMGPLTITSSEPVYRLSPQSETRGVRALFMWW